MEINKDLIVSVYKYYEVDDTSSKWIEISEESNRLIGIWKTIKDKIDGESNIDHFVKSRLESLDDNYCRFLGYGSPLICGRPNVAATYYGVYPFVEEYIDGNRVLRKRVKYETGKPSKNKELNKDDYDSVDGSFEVDQSSKSDAQDYYEKNIWCHLKNMLSLDINSITEDDEKYFEKSSSKLLYRKAAVMNDIANKNILGLIIDAKAVDRLYDSFVFDDGESEVVGDTDESYVTWYKKNKRIMAQAYSWLGVEVNFLNQWCISNMLWELAKCSDISKENPNIIYYGAPGTGKTFNVEKRIKLLTGDEMVDRCSMVQCHPGFGYEEFIEGIKPVGVTTNGKLNLQVVNGSFKKLCIKAINDIDNTYYYVADEINRSNLSEMFGETLSLLEPAYRCQDENDTGNMRTTAMCKMIETTAISIVKKGSGSVQDRLNKAEAYLKENSVWHKSNKEDIRDENVNDYCVEVRFGIPKNIMFIGMMNDVDKSIDSFDLALRRRFIWIPMSCDYDVAVSKIKNNKNAEIYSERCIKLNEYISKRDNKSLGLGKSYEFGHSYFLKIADYLNYDESNLDDACSSLFNDHLRPLLTEYLRSYKDESQIGTCLLNAGKIFTGDNYEYQPGSISSDSLKNKLRRTRNIILYGNPGNGKTHCINEMLQCVFGGDEEKIRDHSVFVQCHPGFGYEDFIEGVKPTGINEDGSIRFEIVNGVFKDLCIKAKQRAEENLKNGEQIEEFYFIADEINRANLSALFGESLSLIEQSYRYNVSVSDYEDNNLHLRETPLSSLISKYIQDKSLDANDRNNIAFHVNAANEVTFGVPDNVYIIGAMNDVDRSIDAFDLALRRRFNWIRVDCDYEVLIRSYRTKNLNKIDDYINRCKELNEFIASNLGFGESYQFGHSVFLNIDKYISSRSKQITKNARGALFDETMSSTLKEYCRNFIEDDIEIENAVKCARSIFVETKK